MGVALHCSRHNAVPVVSPRQVAEADVVACGQLEADVVLENRCDALPPLGWLNVGDICSVPVE